LTLVSHVDTVAAMLEGHADFLAGCEDHVRNVLLPTRLELKNVFKQWKEPLY
jgi:hypothetical protein